MSDYLMTVTPEGRCLYKTVNR